MKQRILLVLLTSAFLLQSPTTLAYCFEQWACVDIQHSGEQVVLVVRNNRPFPFTATLSVASGNYLDSETQTAPDEKTFVVILTNSSRDGALVTKERLQRRLEQTHWLDIGHIMVEGSNTHHTPGESVDELLQRLFEPMHQTPRQRQGGLALYMQNA